MKHALTLLSAAALALVLTLTLAASTGCRAEMEPIDRRLFALYDFVGGLWQIHTSGDLVNANDAMLTKSTADLTADENEKKLGTGIIDAMSPDFTGTCQIEGRPGFPSAENGHQVLGLPADIALGSGKSNVVACSVTANTVKARQVGRFVTGNKSASYAMPSEMQIFLVPVSVVQGTAYLLEPLASMPRAAQKHFSTVYAKELAAAAAAAASTKKADSQEAAAASEAAALSPLIVTHKSELRLKHEAPLSTLLANAGVGGAESDKQTGRRNAKYQFMKVSGAFTPVSAAAAAALAKPDDREPGAMLEPNCRVQPMRFSGVATTTTDALLTVNIKVSPGCKSSISTSTANANGNASEEKGQKSKDMKKADDSDDEDDTEVILLNMKRFASIEDEELTLADDVPWYQRKKFGPTIGAFVLLFVVVGGRHIANWFLKRKGVDANKFLQSTRTRTKEEIVALQKDRARRSAHKVGPTTDEEVSRLQAMEQQGCQKDPYDSLDKK